MHSQVQRGISLIDLPLPSERAGERLYEIPLQIIRHYCSQINPLSLKTAFVTYRESVSYKQAGKRCPFALQNMPFYTSKDALLHCKRASFTTRKGVDGKTRRKEIDKKAASPSPSEGGDVRGNGGMRKEGMCLAGYRMLGVGDIKDRRIKPQIARFNSRYCKV